MNISNLDRKKSCTRSITFFHDEQTTNFVFDPCMENYARLKGKVGHECHYFRDRERVRSSFSHASSPHPTFQLSDLIANILYMLKINVSVSSLAYHY